MKREFRVKEINTWSMFHFYMNLREEGNWWSESLHSCQLWEEWINQSNKTYVICKMTYLKLLLCFDTFYLIWWRFLENSEACETALFLNHDQWVSSRVYLNFGPLSYYRYGELTNRGNL